MPCTKADTGGRQGKNLAKQVGKTKGKRAGVITESSIPLPWHGNPSPPAQMTKNLHQFHDRRWSITSQHTLPASTVPKRLSWGISENMHPRLHASHCRSHKRKTQCKFNGKLQKEAELPMEKNTSQRRTPLAQLADTVSTAKFQHPKLTWHSRNQ